MKKTDPKELAIIISERSICQVKVGAVIEDHHGIFSWGWNSVGKGFGIHAEAHAIERANKRRLKGAEITIASTRRGKVVISLPCNECLSKIIGYGIKIVNFRGRCGTWKRMEIK